MRKLLTLILLLGIGCVSYSDEINVRVIINSADIISPDGELFTYTDPVKIPNLEYSSKIGANGMLILNYYTISIVLKNKQGLFIAKEPLSGRVMFSKIENSRPVPIVVTFYASTVAQVDAETVFSLKYNEKDKSTTMKIVDGHAIMKMGEEKFELVSDETFRYQFKGGQKYAI